MVNQISLGLLALHAKNIIHCDLKSKNVFVHDGVLKIGDLGESKILHLMKYINGGDNFGTPFFMAPEIYKKEKYDH